MAYEHLHTSLTKGNLWLYVLSVLEQKPSCSPRGIKQSVQERFDFAPATITFYSVLYKMTREGLVKRSSGEFRSGYVITPRGREQLTRARALLGDVGSKL